MRKISAGNQQRYFRLFNNRVFYLAFTFLLLLNSCSDPLDGLNNQINIALRNDNKIDEKEWSEFVDYITYNSQELPSLFGSDNKINTNELTDLILKIANKRRGLPAPEIYNPDIIDPKLEKAMVKVFIENSGSMDGYVRNTTEFEAALSDLLVQIQYKYENENLNINFINTKVYPSVVHEVNDFVESLEPSDAPYKVGNRSVSKLNEVLKMILDSTSQKNISILVSDCIYSLESNKDTEGALEFQKSLTKGAFLEKSKEFAFSTIILKMNSMFEGTYYDKNNKTTELEGNLRPYYIWIIGSEEQIMEFSDNINLKSLKGFENSYVLSNSSFNKQPFFTVLAETNKIGSFKQTDRRAREVNSINNVEFEDGKFQFSIAIDLKDIPVDKAYLANSNNYKVPDGFDVVAINKIDQNLMPPNDFTKVSKTSATHFITISMNPKYLVKNLQLELSNQIPEWVKESNSSDDTNITEELNKTFGLLYLVQGVSGAYRTIDPNNISYFKIEVKIKK